MVLVLSFGSSAQVTSGDGGISAASPGNLPVASPFSTRTSSLRQSRWLPSSTRFGKGICWPAFTFRFAASTLWVWVSQVRSGSLQGLGAAEAADGSATRARSKGRGSLRMYYLFGTLSTFRAKRSLPEFRSELSHDRPVAGTGSHGKTRRKGRQKKKGEGPRGPLPLGSVRDA